MRNLLNLRTIVIALVSASAIAAAHAQLISSAPQNRSITKSDPVQYLFPEQVTIPAGKPSAVALHFRIAQGLHINSHTPTEDYLIPTNLSLPAGAAVRLERANYPVGSIITLPIDPKTKLSVYTGDFIIQTSLVSTPGNHLVEGNLHYQACNESQCLPPKTIKVAIDVIGK